RPGRTRPGRSLRPAATSARVGASAPVGSVRGGWGPAIEPVLRIDNHFAKVRYLSRAAWGADESLRFGPGGVDLFPAEYYPLQTLTVHHTAGANNDPDPAATVRAIYYYDAVTQGWGDLGYHFLIDEAGTVYEGRWSGTDGTPAFGPRGADGRLLMCNGAHVSGFNAGNIGVVLLGDFTSQLPTAAARQSLTQLLAALAGAGRLDPTGVTDYVNPVSGAARRVNTISGHRDWMATECPGNTFYPQLPPLRQDVQRRWAG
ncbi:peptidoglycan recognition family protein, partial [Micromonospora zhanjiangensis]